MLGTLLSHVRAGGRRYANSQGHEPMCGELCAHVLCLQVRSPASKGQTVVLQQCSESTDRFRNLVAACDASVQEASRLGKGPMRAHGDMYLQDD